MKMKYMYMYICSNCVYQNGRVCYTNTYSSTCYWAGNNFVACSTSVHYTQQNDVITPLLPSTILYPIHTRTYTLTHILSHSLPQSNLNTSDFAELSAPLLYDMFKAHSEYPLHLAIQHQREDVVFLFLIEFNSQVRNTGCPVEWGAKL